MSKTKIAGWVLSGLFAAFLILVSAAGGKFTDWDGKEEMLEQLGFSADVLMKIGIVEVVVTLLFLIPQTAFVGAILVTGYLGGATVTHVRMGDSFFFPILFGVIAWTALGLRDPRVFKLAFGLGKSTPKKDVASP